MTSTRARPIGRARASARDRGRARGTARRRARREPRSPRRGAPAAGTRARPGLQRPAARPLVPALRPYRRAPRGVGMRWDGCGRQANHPSAGAAGVIRMRGGHDHTQPIRRDRSAYARRGLLYARPRGPDRTARRRPRAEWRRGSPGELPVSPRTRGPVAHADRCSRGRCDRCRRDLDPGHAARGLPRCVLRTRVRGAAAGVHAVDEARARPCGHDRRARDGDCRDPARPGSPRSARVVAPRLPQGSPTARRRPPQLGRACVARRLRAQPRTPSRARRTSQTRSRTGSRRSSASPARRSRSV